MRDVDDYIATLTAGIDALPISEQPIAACTGKVLAKSITALAPVPPWTNSAMDGYAVRASEVAQASEQTPVCLPVSGDVAAGANPAPLPEGTAMRIMTGAAIPPGADAVVQVELTDQAAGAAPLPGQVKIYQAPTLERHIRRAGEDTGLGEPVLPAGTRLEAPQLAAAVATGHGTLAVRPKPRVAVISTGSELTQPGRPLEPGMIPDSNGLMLAALCERWGAQCVCTMRVDDNPANLVRALREAAAQADLVVTSGGVSAGAFDPLKALADQAVDGVNLSFDKLTLQPGKPQGHGTIADGQRQVPLVCLPGNPVSVLVCFTLIVVPVLAALDGRTQVLAWGQGVAGASWRSPAGRRQHVPVHLHWNEQGQAVATPSHRLGSGSHLIGSLHLAQALAVVPGEIEAVEVGQPLRLLSLTPTWQLGPGATTNAVAPNAPGGPSCTTAPAKTDNCDAVAPNNHALAPSKPASGNEKLEFTHLDSAGAARMVDVTAKTPTVRSASAEALVTCSPQVVAALREGRVPKGDVLAVARIAGIAATKKVPELLPLAHVIGVHGASVDPQITDAGVLLKATVRTADRTGVEMEALTAVTVAALAVVDMVKGVDRSAAIDYAYITAKSGGRSGTWTRADLNATATASAAPTESAPSVVEPASQAAAAPATPES